MRVLVGCEYSGIVRDAFALAGHDAWSCDLDPTERPGKHITGDVLSVLNEGWDLGIFHPPCTYLCSSGLHWNTRVPGRSEKTEAALAFVQALLGANIPKIAVENPTGCISTRIRPYDQKIQPYEFGHDASKGTCLWLKNLPLLPIDPNMRYPGRWVQDKNGKLVERWGNQTDSGQNKLGPTKDKGKRGKDRSKTYPLIAAAMVACWGAT